MMAQHVVNISGGKDSTARIHTPTPFRDMLIAMASTAVAEAAA